MNSNKIKKGLGRGLSSLIGETKIETAINKSRYKNHSFGDYDKFIMTQIMTKENLGNNNSKDNWLKTSEGRKAVSIAKL